MALLSPPNDMTDLADANKIIKIQHVAPAANPFLIDIENKFCD
jgi:hypothetical protein